MAKLTPKQIDLLKILSRYDAGLSWAILSGPQNANGTRLSRMGMTEWKGPGHKKVLHITEAGRAAIKEADKS